MTTGNAEVEATIESRLTARKDPELVASEKSRAAKILGIDRKALCTKPERYGLDAPGPTGKGAA